MLKASGWTLYVLPTMADFTCICWVGGCSFQNLIIWLSSCWEGSERMTSSIYSHILYSSMYMLEGDTEGEFSNLSRPTPTKINLFPSQSHEKTGGKSRPVPLPEEWLPFPPTPVLLFFFFGRNLSVTVKIQYRSQRAHLISWIKTQNVVFCYYIELKAILCTVLHRLNFM